MLTGWMTFTALLAGSVNPGRPATGQVALSVAPTCGVKGRPEAQLALNCGDGKEAGLVRFWHTPFGELHRRGAQSDLDPVFVHLDGRLVIPNSSVLHSGLYYCLLQRAGGTTLWPYELHVGHDHHRDRERGEYEQSGGCATIGLSGDVGSEGETQTPVSDETFAGAVAASVLLTFVLGFSLGALSRSHVLRCLGALTKRLRLPRQQTDMVDSGSQFPMSATLPMSQGCETGQTQDDDSVNCTSIDTTASSPPTKPQRSFRHKREEQQETAAYDHKNEEEEEEEAGRATMCGEEREDGGSLSNTDDDRDEKDGGQSREKQENRWEEDDKSEDEGERSRVSEEEKEDERMEDEGWRDEKEGEDGETTKTEDIYRDSHSSTETKDETDGGTQEDTETAAGGDEAPPAPPCAARRSRVIRLYQYDEDGQRYGHLPDADPEDPGPVPRPRQRTRSLTRLGAIMAAASAGPLDTQETEDGPHFHMDI